MSLQVLPHLDGTEPKISGLNDRSNQTGNLEDQLRPCESKKRKEQVNYRIILRGVKNIKKQQKKTQHDMQRDSIKTI